MKILAIETSCDETAVAILDGDSVSHTTFSVLGTALYSQSALHAPYGGVYPSLAKREHQANLVPLAMEALKDAHMFLPQSGNTSVSLKDAEIPDEEFKKSIAQFLSTYKKPEIDLIAVTHGPGLEPALWTGINFAESLGKTWDIPVMGIDHMEGHIVSALLKKPEAGLYTLHAPEFPVLALLISGGHTEFVLMKEWFSYEHIGHTKDDALGEAFDKVARLLDLPYPGGPHIGTYAERSRKRGEAHGIEFPRPLSKDDTCDFSFSGLKTAVLYKLRGMDKISENDKEHIAEAFENAARDVVLVKTRRALEKTHPKTFVVGGGVSANVEIRRALTELMKEFPQITLLFPHEDLTGDNAIMIGAAAYLRRQSGAKPSGALTALGNLHLA